jgi:hypothetical protein
MKEGRALSRKKVRKDYVKVGRMEGLCEERRKEGLCEEWKEGR